MNKILTIGSFLGFVFMLVLASIPGGIITFHYPEVIQDEPLVNPVHIAKIEKDRLFLKNGSVLRLRDEPPEDGWAAVFQQSALQIDVEYLNETSAIIYARQDGWICGTPWAALIRIPLIPDLVYKNRRELITTAELDPAPPAAPDAD